MSLLRATGNILLFIFIIFTVLDNFYVVQPLLERSAQQNACKAWLAAQATEQPNRFDQLSSCEPSIRTSSRL